jgi:hypothetical protein
MSDNQTDRSRSFYSFGDTNLAAERLRVVSEVFDPISEAFVSETVRNRPRPALDLRCGPGSTTRLLFCSSRRWTDGALAVLREVVKLGITHIDTGDFYGPHITTRLIKEALHPYPEQLRIVTRVGALRDAEGNWPKALSPDQLRQAIHDNLREPRSQRTRSDRDLAPSLVAINDFI